VFRCFTVSCDEKVRLHEFKRQEIRPVMGGAIKKEILVYIEARRFTFVVPAVSRSSKRIRKSI
jgi:hypothetical protein